MTVNRKNIRSVKDIHTHSGSVAQAAIPYKMYMRISCLEMEKARRLKEKEQALARIDLIDTRVMEIEAEKQALKNELAQVEEVTQFFPSQLQKNKAKFRQCENATAQSDSCATEGFKIRY
jgi:DNA repair exonuclease SbcCD ATPase subunit